MGLDARIPEGALAEKWDRCRFGLKLVNPANKRKYRVIVVGTGLAGSSASASLAELGYAVDTFCIQDTPRRAHSIAAQGGINAAKNYRNDGDSVMRLFYDTIKGGDFRSREANVYRLAQISNGIIDQCVAQGVPFAREYGGHLANRSFGGAQVSRTFYARGQTGQQLLLGAYGALSRQIASGMVNLYARREMLELVVVDGRAAGIVVRNLITGGIEMYCADAVVLATGGYGNVFYLSTNAMSSNVSALMCAYRKGAFFANPCFTQIHPTCIPVHGAFQSKLTLMSESLRNDGRVWVPVRSDDKRAPDDIPEESRDYFLERKYPAFGNLVPRDVAARSVKEQCDAGKGVGESGYSVYLDFKDALKRDGREAIEQKYGNLFSMYSKITGDKPYESPMKIYPASHYAMGGLWVDYHLMSTVPGLFVLGEANFSDHGANRLGASALMQGLADGYFILPSTMGGYLAGLSPGAFSGEEVPFAQAVEHVKDKTDRLLSADGGRTCDDFHRELGRIMWENCGMARSDEELAKARHMVSDLKEAFKTDIKITGSGDGMNQNLEKASRVWDFMEFAGLMIEDALARRESCGSHFNVKFQTADHEAMRDDENCSHVSAWEYKGAMRADMHREPLIFETVEPSRRSYK